MPNDHHGSHSNGEARTQRTPPRRATLEDVARLAGVSKGTASRALANKAGVHSLTRELVQKAALQIDFRPNAIARNLFTGMTGTVGILTNDLDGRFVIPILAGAEDALGAGKISVILCDARGDAIREQQHLRTLLDRRIDGLIVVGGARTDPRPPIGRDLPVPVVYAYAPSTDPSDLSITADNVLGGRLAAEHLWQIGRRNIAYVGGNNSYLANREREQGARAALAELGSNLISTHQSTQGYWNERWGRAETTHLLERFPEIDSIIGASDILARAVLDILRDYGKRVPEDVAVVGFDNWSIIVQNTRPELTSIDMELETLGRIAASRLFFALSGEAMNQGVERLPVTLCIRQSTIVGG